MGTRSRPTPRGPQERPGGLATALFCLVMAALVCACLWFGLLGTREAGREAGRESEVENVTKVTHDSLAPTFTHDGEVIRWYVLVDPDTEVQYLVNDRGGCCPRLDSYGRVMGVRYE